MSPFYEFCFFKAIFEIVFSSPLQLENPSLFPQHGKIPWDDLAIMQEHLYTVS